MLQESTEGGDAGARSNEYPRGRQVLGRPEVCRGRGLGTSSAPGVCTARVPVGMSTPAVERGARRTVSLGSAEDEEEEELTGCGLEEGAHADGTGPNAGPAQQQRRRHALDPVGRDTPL